MESASFTPSLFPSCDGLPFITAVIFPPVHSGSTFMNGRCCNASLYNSFLNWVGTMEKSLLGHLDVNPCLPTALTTVLLVGTCGSIQFLWPFNCEGFVMSSCVRWMRQTDRQHSTSESSFKKESFLKYSVKGLTSSVYTKHDTLKASF